jgi:hypothetical protein
MFIWDYEKNQIIFKYNFFKLNNFFRCAKVVIFNHRVNV